MFHELFSNPLSFLIWFFALAVAVTIHEFAHAYSADRLGDPTPRLMGRLTLNPLAHLDPLGTLMLLLVRFGWGKPVQFDPFNLQNPRRDAAVISLAGPTSNLILAVILSIILRFISSLGVLNILSLLISPIIILNIVLAVFNLLPIHPLDGFKVVGGFLSEEKAQEWEQLRSYGIFILIFLLLPIGPSGAFISTILGLPINLLLTILLP